MSDYYEVIPPTNAGSTRSCSPAKLTEYDELESLIKTTYKAWKPLMSSHRKRIFRLTEYEIDQTQIAVDELLKQLQVLRFEANINLQPEKRVEIERRKVPKEMKEPRFTKLNDAICVGDMDSCRLLLPQALTQTWATRFSLSTALLKHRTEAVDMLLDLQADKLRAMKLPVCDECMFQDMKDMFFQTVLKDIEVARQDNPDPILYSACSKKFIYLFVYLLLQKQVKGWLISDLIGRIMLYGSPTSLKVIATHPKFGRWANDWLSYAPRAIQSRNTDVLALIFPYIIKATFPKRVTIAQMTIFRDLPARKECIDFFKKVISDPMQRQSIGLSDLGHAAFCGDEEAVKRLLKARASWVCDTEGRSVRFWAFWGQKVGVLKLLKDVNLSEEEMLYGIGSGFIYPNNEMILYLLQFAKKAMRHHDVSTKHLVSVHTMLRYRQMQLISRQMILEDSRLFRYLKDLYSPNMNELEVLGANAVAMKNSLYKVYYRTFTEGFYKEPSAMPCDWSLGYLPEPGEQRWFTKTPGGGYVKQMLQYHNDTPLRVTPHIFRYIYKDDPIALKDIDLALKFQSRYGEEKDQKQPLMHGVALENTINRFVYLEVQCWRKINMAQRKTICVDKRTLRRLRYKISAIAANMVHDLQFCMVMGANNF